MAARNTTVSDQLSVDGRFELRASISRLVRRVMELSLEHPELEFECRITGGNFKLLVPKGDAGDVVEQILVSEGLVNITCPLKPKTTLWMDLTDGRKMRSVAPLVQNLEGKYESVCAIIYTADGLPCELVLVGNDNRTVPVADWEPMEDM